MFKLITRRGHLLKQNKFKKTTLKPESQMLRLVVYRLIECLAYMGHSSIWKLICAISVSNILTVGVHLSSTPSKSILDPPLLTIPESKLSDIKERQNMDHKIT